MSPLTYPISTSVLRNTAATGGFLLNEELGAAWNDAGGFWNSAKHTPRREPPKHKALTELQLKARSEKSAETRNFLM
ncbi:hypothetical protein COCON_G00017210 [Conger conger]|uniref:Uncharacterized protein n=1 Tax=Conger conger TaxID=82655 RepID=A0A9Q1I7U2_CONCO|nr:hypothetical protein COCON_G00017210 [Conger conger]